MDALTGEIISNCTNMNRSHNKKVVPRGDPFEPGIVRVPTGTSELTMCDTPTPYTQAIPEDNSWESCNYKKKKRQGSGSLIPILENKTLKDFPILNKIPGFQFSQNPAKENVPKIRMQNTCENQRIINSMPCLTQEVPAPWGYNAIIASIVFCIFNSLPIRGAKYQNIELPDGGQVMLDWYCDSNPKENGTVLICPGLNLKSRSYYILTLATALQKRGFNVVALNYRGVDQELKSEKLGFTESWMDFPIVLRKIGERLCYKNGYPNADPKVEEQIKNLKMYAVGTSLGGINLSRYSVEQDKGIASDILCDMPAVPLITGQVLVSTPLEVDTFVHETFSQSSIGYTVSMILTLMFKVVGIMSHWRNPYWRSTIQKVGWWNWITAKTVADLGNIFAHPFGLCNGSQYWKSCSSRDEIGRNENSATTLMIISKNDFVVPTELCQPTGDLPKRVIYVESAPGGHIAFGGPDMGWVNDAICNFFSHLKHTPETNKATTTITATETTKNSGKTTITTTTITTTTRTMNNACQSPGFDEMGAVFDNSN